jgi:NAD(P)-dependent dehydrogenase (short-subunit alcohol dehydrogenase family)
VGSFVVSGAGSGIGDAVRERLLVAGHRVVGIDLRGVEVSADLSTAAGRSAAIEAVRDACAGGDGVDGIVAAAGVAWPHPEPDSLAAVNFFGARDLLLGVRPIMAAQGTSYAVAVSSLAIARTALCPEDLLAAFLAGDEPTARRLALEHGAHAAYVASKLALARWVREQSVTTPWAGAGIRLNAVAPGITRTPMMVGNAAAAGTTVDQVAIQAKVPLGRAGRPDEVAALITALMSPAADYLVGQVIFVDGGLESMARMHDWPAQPDPASTEPVPDDQ